MSVSFPKEHYCAPWGVYPCADQTWCPIEVSTEEEWHYLTVAMGHPELMAYPDYDHVEARVRNREVLDKHIREWTQALSATDVKKALANVGVPGRIARGPTV